MVQDVINSKRDQSNIAHLQPETQHLSALIVSSQYWPQTNGDAATTTAESAGQTLPYRLPESVQSLYSLYQVTYAEIKKPREIRWLAQCGCVDLEIELNGQSVKMKTTPLNASVLLLIQQHFEEEAEEKRDGDALWIGRDALCGLTGMDHEEVAPAMTFWIRRGVVKKGEHSEEGVGYRLADGAEEELYALQCLKKKSQNAMDGQDGGAQNMDPAERLQIEEQFERQVLALFNVHQGKPIEHIYGLIKVLDVHPMFSGANMDMNALQEVVDKLTIEKRVVFKDGLYTRPKV